MHEIEILKALPFDLTYLVKRTTNSVLTRLPAHLSQFMNKISSIEHTSVAHLIEPSIHSKNVKAFYEVDIVGIESPYSEIISEEVNAVQSLSDSRLRHPISLNRWLFTKKPCSNDEQYVYLNTIDVLTFLFTANSEASLPLDTQGEYFIELEDDDLRQGLLSAAILSPNFLHSLRRALFHVASEVDLKQNPEIYRRRISQGDLVSLRFEVLSKNEFEQQAAIYQAMIKSGDSGVLTWAFAEWIQHHKSFPNRDEIGDLINAVDAELNSNKSYAGKFTDLRYTPLPDRKKHILRALSSRLISRAICTIEEKESRVLANVQRLKSYK